MDGCQNTILDKFIYISINEVCQNPLDVTIKSIPCLNGNIVLKPEYPFEL